MNDASSDAYTLLTYKIAYSKIFKNKQDWLEQELVSDIIGPKFTRSEALGAVSLSSQQGLLKKTYLCECSRCKTVTRIDEENSPKPFFTWEQLLSNGYECSFCQYQQSVDGNTPVVYNAPNVIVPNPIFEDFDNPNFLIRSLKGVYKWLTAPFRTK